MAINYLIPYMTSDQFATYTQREEMKRAALPPSRSRRRRGKRLCGFPLLRIAVSLLMIILLVYMIGFISFIRSLTKDTKSSNTKQTVNYHASSEKYASPLLIITCKRPEYLSRTLEGVLAAMSNQCEFGCPIIISEDGRYLGIENVVKSFKEKFEKRGIPLIHIHHKRDMRLTKKPYEELAQHFGWALSQTFEGAAIYPGSQNIQQQPLPQRVILLEEDILISPDFFSYMKATSSLLDNDPTLYAVSAFNDNGHLAHGDPKRLLRSDFFPGLGWMMNRDLWINELGSKWPEGYWDDWLREPEQRKGRQVIRPEISRTLHFGTKGGASSNQFGEILEHVKLNTQEVQWDLEDLSYLENSRYELQYTKLVTSSELVHSIDEAKNAVQNVRMEYNDLTHFCSLAKELGLMDDEKALVPRTAYRGIVEVRLGSNILFLTRKGGFKGYYQQ